MNYSIIINLIITDKKYKSILEKILDIYKDVFNTKILSLIGNNVKNPMICDKVSEMKEDLKRAFKEINWDNIKNEEIFSSIIVPINKSLELRG